MSSKLFIPKSTLKGIADAIRAKTGDSGTIKVKNMPSAIQNIPEGSVSVDTDLDLSVDDVNNVKAVLLTEIDETDSNIRNTGVLVEATVELKGMPALSKKTVNIGSFNTDSNGEVNTTLESDYEEITATFKGSKSFKEAIKTIYPVTIPKMILHVYTEDKSIYINPITQSNIKTYIDDVEVPNNNGKINKTMAAGTGPLYKVEYKANFTNGLNSASEWENIVKAEIPAAITDLGDAFIDNYDIQELIINNMEVLSYMSITECGELKHLTLPSNLLRIEPKNFLDMSNLLDITLPASIEYPVESNFSDCRNMKYLRLADGYHADVDFKVSEYAELERLVLAGSNTSAYYPEYANDWFGAASVSFVSFNHETKYLMGGMGERGNEIVKDVKRLDFPVCCKAIRREVNPSFKRSTSNVCMRFWSVIPPRPEEYLNVPNGVMVYIPAGKNDDEEYNIINRYRDFFSSYGISDYYLETAGDNGKGITQITFMGDCLEISDEHLNSPFWDLVVYDSYSWLNGDEITFDVRGFANIHLDGLNDIENVFTINGYFTMISEPAFRANKQLTEFVFPYSCEEICDEAFKDCSNLNTLIFYGQPPIMYENSFTGLNPDCKVYVPASHYIDYRNSVLGGYKIIPYSDSENEAEISRVDDYLFEKQYETGDLDYDNAKSYFEQHRPR